MNLPEKWKWLEELFGSRDEYREALCAYYIALNVIEYADAIADNQEAELREAQSAQARIDLDIPLEFLREDQHILRKAYRLFLTEPEKVKIIWQSKNISYAKMKELWPVWTYHLRLWLSSQGYFLRRLQIIHDKLFDELEQ